MNSRSSQNIIVHPLWIAAVLVSLALLDKTSQSYTIIPRQSKCFHYTARIGNHRFHNTQLHASPDSQTENTANTKKDANSDLNYYEVLGASQDATRSELKKKYVTLARVSHPDAQISNINDDNVDFQAVAEAWRTLGNPKSRRRYDRTLKAKAWGDAAQKLADNSLESVAPAAASFMDNLAVPFLRRTSYTTMAVGKAIAKGVEAATASTATTTNDDNKPKNSQEETTNTNSSSNSTTTTNSNSINTNNIASTTTSNSQANPTNTIPSTTTPPIPEPNGSDNSSFSNTNIGSATIETTPDSIIEEGTSEEVKQKSIELQEQVEHEENKARSINEELDSIKKQRAWASLQNNKDGLSSGEAQDIWDTLSGPNTVSFEPKPRNNKRTHIEKEIASLRNTENQFTKKLEDYTEIDTEWNSWLTKQEDAQQNLNEKKQVEDQCRKELETAEANVEKATIDVKAVSSKLRGVEQEVRNSAREMDKVSATLHRKQERVRNALKKKTELMKGGISMEYVTEEEVEVLRQKESQLMGESQQIATMVEKLQSRADLLKKRAKALDALKNL